MKKFLIKTMAVSMAIFFIIPQTFADTNFATGQNDEALVNFDENEIYRSFDEISELVSYISENNVTYSEVKASDSTLVEGVSPTAAIALDQGESEYPLILGPFWWGCLFSALGIFLVAFVTNNNAKKIEMAVWGCIVANVVFPATFILLYALGFITLYVG